MKKVFLFIWLFFALNATSQSNYEKGMQQAFALWDEGKLTEASQLFERIAAAEKENWLPPFYAAYIEILGSFGIKDETILNAKLTKAQKLLDDATSISENNPEIIITQALLNTAYIAFDGQRYGMTMSGKNSQLYAKALQIAPKNPRVILGNAEWNMGAAKFFGQSTKPFCDEIKRVIEIGKEEKNDIPFYPRFQLKRAEDVLKKCEG
jgi:tetratricopeptide (TPR) repeat protein